MYLSSLISHILRIGLISVLPNGNVELAIRAKVDVAAIMVGGTNSVGRGKYSSKSRADTISLNEASYPVLLGRAACATCATRVIDIDKMVIAEIGIQGNAEETLFTVSVHSYGEHGLGLKHTVSEQANSSRVTCSCITLLDIE
jgi:hypothetical protein